MNKVLLVLLLLLPVFEASAEDIFDIAEEYNNQKKKVSRLEIQKRKMLADIYEIEKATEKLEIKKTDLDEEKVGLDHALKQTSQQIVSIEKEIRVMTPDLTRRLAFVEKVNGLPWFYAFLTSQSVTDLDRINKAAENINKEQSEKIVRYVNLHKDLERQKHELRQTAIKIVGLKKEIVEEEKKISKNQKKKSRMLSQLNKTLGKRKQRLEHLKGKGKKAAQESEFKNLGLLFGTGFFEKKGDLPHPIKAPVVQAFGLNQMLSRDNVKLIHKGLFYRSSEEQEAKAIAEGRVEYSKKVPGYGHTVVIDHGGRYYTTYGNLIKSDLKKGQMLKAGDVVGSTGHSHLQFNKGLYFEIRHFSEPQDPEKWLKQRNGKLATL